MNTRYYFKIGYHLIPNCAPILLDRSGRQLNKVCSLHCIYVVVFILIFILLAMGSVAGIVKKQLGPHLKTLLPYWLAARFDPSREVARAAYPELFQQKECKEEGKTKELGE